MRRMKDEREIIFPDGGYFQFRDKIKLVYPENVLLIKDEKDRKYMSVCGVVYRLKRLKKEIRLCKT